MSVDKPYVRIWRPFTDDLFTFDRAAYLRSEDYAFNMTDSIRGYHQLEKELINIFDFVEPSNANLNCYSYRLYALLLRACTEFEFNAKAILSENDYAKDRKNQNILDFAKLNSAMRLSEYTVTCLPWYGEEYQFEPFSEWQDGHSLYWYKAYNSVKHNRGSQFPEASLKNTISAITGVFVLVFAQFYIRAFNSNHEISIYSEDSGWLSHETCCMKIKPASSWSQDERYHFNWESLKESDRPIQKFNF